MVDNEKEVRRQILNVIGYFAAGVTILTYLALCINAAWPFLDSTSTVYNVLSVIRTWAPLVVVGVVGLEYTATKNILVRILFYVAIALIVIFMFFPSTWSDFVGIVNDNI